MTLHLQRQIDKLKQMILRLGRSVEGAVDQAIRAMENRDGAMAAAVIDGDVKIDRMEIDIEEECLHTLALHQPVAFDLRYVVTVLKMNNDLERIADLAANVAEQVKALAELPELDVVPFDLAGMIQRVRKMLSDALRALIEVDVDLADAVRAADDEVDIIHRRMYAQIIRAMQENPDRIPQLLRFLGMSRYLERMADQTVNIAEDVLYLARGEIKRHEESMKQLS